MTDVAFLIPRRADGGHRDRLFEFVAKWWADRFPSWPVTVGEDVGPGPFNRAAALNRAASAAGDWDVALVADGDVVAEPEQVTAGVELAASTGRAVLCYSQRVDLNPAMTEQVLAGFSGNWSPGRMRAYTAGDGHISSLIAVPRALWDRVGGFDERFVGWGGEDRAAHMAWRVLGGGVNRVPGTVWHLWHPPAPEVDRKRPEARAWQGLVRRYYEALDPAAMVRLLAERDDPDGVCLVVVTDGRHECISRAVESVLAHVKGLSVTRKVICDDSGDADYQAWLRLEFPGFELVCGPKRLGYVGAMRRAWDVALSSGQRWVLWWEDDFVLNDPLDVSAMAEVLDARPDLANLVLVRQAWTDGEKAAGGIVAQHPAEHADDEVAGWPIVTHRRGYWMNPHLVARSTLARFVWPAGTFSERTMGQQMVRAGLRFAYWGRRDDAPRVEHIGAERKGTGY